MVRNENIVPYLARMYLILDKFMCICSTNSLLYKYFQIRGFRYQEGNSNNGLGWAGNRMKACRRHSRELQPAMKCSDNTSMNTICHSRTPRAAYEQDRIKNGVVWTRLIWALFKPPLFSSLNCFQEHRSVFSSTYV